MICKLKKLIKIKSALLFIVVFLLGYQTHKAEIFPLNKFYLKLTKNHKIDTWQYKGSPRAALNNDYTFNKIKVACPSAEESIVIVAFGQSNSANNASQKFMSTNSDNILNFYRGSCYIAEDPLLGTSGKKGNIWIPTGLKLNKGQKKVILITYGIGGTSIENWLTDLKYFYLTNLNSLKLFYPKPDFVIWFQGENDNRTNPNKFKKNLETWIQILMKDFSKAKLIITGTTYCNGFYSAEIKDIQLSVSKKYNVNFFDTDQFNHFTDRHDDCHFSYFGVEKLSTGFAKIINSNL
jgi:hypothetical protein